LKRRHNGQEGRKRCHDDEGLAINFNECYCSDTDDEEIPDI
jgi:hypothetical protein